MLTEHGAVVDLTDAGKQGVEIRCPRVPRRVGVATEAPFARGGRIVWNRQERVLMGVAGGAVFIGDVRPVAPGVGRGWASIWNCSDSTTTSPRHTVRCVLGMGSGTPAMQAGLAQRSLRFRDIFGGQGVVFLFVLVRSPLLKYEGGGDIRTCVA